CVAGSVLGSGEEAEDVMQDAYVRAYAHLNQFANRAKFSTWLTKIAVHEALARGRRARRFEAIDSRMESESDGMIPLVSSSLDPERQLFDQVMKALLEAAIDSLPEEYRAVFALREVEGTSTVETAGALGT